MNEEKLEETHYCGPRLIRVSTDVAANPHNCSVVRYPACPDIVRRER